MTPSRDDVIRMAREAGLTANSPYVRGKLERFAALVAESAAAAEREKCAQIAYLLYACARADEIEMSIRARSTKP